MNLIDLKGQSVVSAIINPKSQTNNTGAGGLDLSNYTGLVCVTVSVGTKTVGDADGAISVRVATSATNNISNAVNYGTSVINTSNNATVIGDLSVDTRNCLRYLFAIPTVTGTNSPAYPLSVTARGFQVVEPVQPALINGLTP